MVTHNIPEIWGGIECSYTRVNNCYSDQLEFCGHYLRGEKDIELIAELGFRALRYPVIWERYKTSDPQTSWGWVERQLNALRTRNIVPIAGLLHHGSGPIHACLDDPCFPVEISRYARLVAERFPWLEYYTPINEPLTTARFCGLYGFWYPHRRDAKAFAEILLNELKAIVLSMREIRHINPSAKLIQTEDLGKIYSTPLLQYQAEFENERRWLTYDLLCGNLKPGDRMWDYLTWLGINDKDLYFFNENPCPPATLGLDYYATSERFLDENLSKYPVHTHGSNGKHHYADVEAIRVRIDEPTGPKVLLQECWDRYQIPMAITEVHIHGSEHEQIRWFNRIWQTCLDLNSGGVDIRGVTAWAMFGSFGWSKLLTECPGEYERGVFDVQNGVPIKTAYTEYLKSLSMNPFIRHESFSEQGWWESEDRFIFDDNTLVS